MIPLFRFQGASKILPGIASTLESGRLSAGQKIIEFENKLGIFLGTPNIVAVANATNGIELALRALNVGVGDEIIVPAYTFPAAPNGVIARGGRPVFVDIDSKSLNIDLEKVREAITPRTKAIIVVHAFGLCINKGKLQDLRDEFGIPVIEDAACALGAKFEDDTYAGTLGDFAIFSFHQRKILNTGEGGVVVTRDPLDVEKIKQLRSHGMQYGDFFGTFHQQGFNYRWNELAATIGIYALGHLEEEIQRRNLVAKQYVDVFSTNLSLDLSAAQVDQRRIFQSFTLRFRGNQSVKNIISAYRRKGIEATVGTYHLPEQNAFAIYTDGENFPESRRAFDEVVAIPILGDMSKNEIQQVIDATLSISDSFHINE